MYTHKENAQTNDHVITIKNKTQKPRKIPQHLRNLRRSSSYTVLEKWTVPRKNKSKTKSKRKGSGNHQY